MANLTIIIEKQQISSQVLKYLIIWLIKQIPEITYQRLLRQKNEFQAIAKARPNNSLFGRKKKKKQLKLQVHVLMNMMTPLSK